MSTNTLGFWEFNQSGRPPVVLSPLVFMSEFVNVGIIRQSDNDKFNANN